MQDQVNAALSGGKTCRNVGIGKDGKVLCRWLGGDKAACTFDHPPADLALKGKGVSKDVPSPQWLNTGRKLHNITADSCCDFPDCDEEFWHTTDRLPLFPDSPSNGEFAEDE